MLNIHRIPSKGTTNFFNLSFFLFLSFFYSKGILVLST